MAKEFRHFWDEIIQADTSPEELRHQIEEMQRLGKYLYEIIENNPDGIYITDGEANAILINKAFERISGLKREDLMGKNNRELVERGIIKRSCAVEALDQHREVTIIHEYLTTKRQALDTCTPYFDENGKIQITISSIRDLTQLNNINRRCEQEIFLRQRAEARLSNLSENVNQDEDLIVHSHSMQKVLQMANRMATVSSRVLITGETGTGKEVIARYIHRHGNRKNSPFIAVNCGAFPASLIESVLFGYVDGAFTGAKKGGSAGLIEAADGGTLFLDEIGELPLEMQTKLLRFLQENVITRVGGTKEIPVSTRVISATNRNLMEMVKEGSFREDLYYRLNVVPIKLPPLRERQDDIVPMARHFLREYNEQYGTNKYFSGAALRTLIHYEWPGNVREFRNLVERLIAVTDGDLIGEEDLPMAPYLPPAVLDAGTDRPVPLKERLERYEYDMICDAYERCHNVRKAAAYLEMSEPTFVRKRKIYQKKYYMQTGQKNDSIMNK